MIELFRALKYSDLTHSATGPPDGRLTRTNCDEAGDYVVHNVLSPRDLVSRPDSVDETVLSSSGAHDTVC